MFEYCLLLMFFQTLNVYFPLQFVKIRITTIHNNSILGDGWVLRSLELI